MKYGLSWYGLSRLEQETVIIFNQAEPEAWVTTASKPVINRLKRAGFHPTTKFGAHVRFIIPKSRITFRSRQKAARSMKMSEIPVETPKEKKPSNRGAHLKEAWAKDPEGMRAKLAAARAAKKAKKEQENG